MTTNRSLKGNNCLGKDLQHLLGMKRKEVEQQLEKSNQTLSYHQFQVLQAPSS